MICPECGSNRTKMMKNGLATCRRCKHRWNPALDDLGGMW